MLGILYYTICLYFILVSKCAIISTFKTFLLINYSFITQFCLLANMSNMVFGIFYPSTCNFGSCFLFITSI
jgi:hypothetical protein